MSSTSVSLGISSDTCSKTVLNKSSELKETRNEQQQDDKELIHAFNTKFELSPKLTISIVKNRHISATNYTFVALYYGIDSILSMISMCFDYKYLENRYTWQVISNFENPYAIVLISVIEFEGTYYFETTGETGSLIYEEQFYNILFQIFGNDYSDNTGIYLETFVSNFSAITELNDSITDRRRDLKRLLKHIVRVLESEIDTDIIDALTECLRSTLHISILSSFIDYTRPIASSIVKLCKRNIIANNLNYQLHSKASLLLVRLSMNSECMHQMLQYCTFLIPNLVDFINNNISNPNWKFCLMNYSHVLQQLKVNDDRIFHITEIPNHE